VRGHRPLALVKKMIDAVVRNEQQPDVLQISGGEPTLHPEFFEILAMQNRSRSASHGEYQRHRIAQMKHLVVQMAKCARQIWKFTCNSIRSSANRFWSYAAPIFDAPGSRPWSG